MFSQYFQVGFFPRFDYCNFIENSDKSNFLYAGVKLLQARQPDSVHVCPYENDEMQIKNLTVTNEDFSFLPSGKYKVICTFSDDDDKKILRMITHVTV